MLSSIGAGFAAVLQPSIILLMLIGVCVGIICGALPGVTIGLGVTLGLTFSFGMDTIPAFALLVALYIGGVSGGLISAILLRIPGTANSFATTFDGHPMARNGQPTKALGVAMLYSFLGTWFGIAVMMFLSPWASKFAVRLSPMDFFALTLFALSLASSLSGESLAKALLSCCIGLSLGMVGVAPIDGFPRFTFGYRELTAGFNILPAVVGIFAVSEVIKAGEPLDTSMISIEGKEFKGFGVSWREFKDQFRNFTVSSLIGIGIGILPGIGGAVSNLLAYGTVKNISKYPDKFGTGIMDGIVATETANNATIGGTMIPLLTLGIPGDGTTALLLSAFLIHGITPGPFLFRDEGLLVYAIFAAMIVSNIIMILVEYYGIRFFVRMLSIPKYLLLPLILVLCMVGAFTVNNRVFDMWVLVLFGVIGILLDKCRYPHAPCILGFVLGGFVEIYLRRGMQQVRGNFWEFFHSPMALSFFILTALTLFFQFRKAWIRMRRERRVSDPPGKEA